MQATVARLSSALMAASLAVACSSGGETSREPTSSPGFDEDVDPELLDDYMGKADGNPCANHAGGTLAGDDLLVVVNKEPSRQLRADWRPSDLVSIASSGMIPGRTGQARLATERASEELTAAAKREAGLTLGIRSAFRSFETQCFTFNYMVETLGYDHASQYSARPGRSEHQLGTAVDVTAASVGWELTQDLATKKEGVWLASNAHRFGFALSYPEGYERLTGYGYEPWHFRYIGREAASEMAASGLTMIEYLLACDASDSRFACPREPAPQVEPNEGFVGGTCETAADCSALDGTRQCLDMGYPGGYCTVPCALYCPDRAGANAGTFCLADPLDPATGNCHAKCDPSLFPGTGCREGYACRQGTRPNGAGTGSVCVPQ
jgi:D-alanyl-D-alanine carboxypeptidase